MHSPLKPSSAHPSRKKFAQVNQSDIETKESSTTANLLKLAKNQTRQSNSQTEQVIEENLSGHEQSRPVFILAQNDHGRASVNTNKLLTGSDISHIKDAVSSSTHSHQGSSKRQIDQKHKYLKSIMRETRLVEE